MKLNKIQIASILLGFATVASAQTSLFSSTAGGSDQSQIQIAQAVSNQPGAGGQGNQGAAGMGQGGGQQQRKGPPPQAIEACKGKSSGAACSFTGRNNQTVIGSCFAPPAGGQASAPNSSGASGAQGNHPPACRPQQGGQQGGPNRAPGG